MSLSGAQGNEADASGAASESHPVFEVGRTKDAVYRHP